MPNFKTLLFVTPSETSTQWGLFILRVAMAFFMIPHGYNKFNDLMAGGGTDFPDPFGVGPQVSLGLTVFAEFFCSILLLLGLATRFALIPLIICVFVIAFKIHWSDPLGDKEHALLYLAGYLANFLGGPGKFSVDERLVGTGEKG